MADFEQTRFLTYDCWIVYYEDLAQKKLLPKWVISLEQVPEKLPAFCQRLKVMG